MRAPCAKSPMPRNTLRLCSLALAAWFGVAGPALAQDQSPGDSQPQAQADPQAASEAVQTPPPPPATPAPRARVLSDAGPLDAIGSTDGDDKAHVEFTPLGAGVAHLALPDSFQTTAHKTHVDLQSVHTREDGVAAVPFAVLAAVVDDRSVDLTGIGRDGPVWRQVSPGVFEAFVDTPEGSPLLRIERAFDLKGADLYGFTLTTTVTNLSGRDVKVALVETGPIDLPKPDNTYGGDRRRFRYGYLFDAEKQGTDVTVTVDDTLASRNSLLGRRVNKGNAKLYSTVDSVWPTPKAREKQLRLSWLGITDRYFAVVVHPELDPQQVASPEDKLLTGFDAIDRLVLNPGASPIDTVMVLRLTTKATTLPAGQSATREVGVYAGPMSRKVIAADPLLASLRVPAVVVYSMGGVCAPCTFAWLTDALMGVLHLFHSFTGDWAISIMLLVVLVRSVLHPVTRWSQIRLQRFSAQMSGMAPKQAKIKEKYKDDPERQKQEMAKLWKEEGVNPAGALGCLPMFLQTPVWMALYATLFFAIELRQEPAFYGVFQAISGGRWQFLSDLSQPDHAIPLPKLAHFSFPLWGAVASINLLPVFMGVLMWGHQKFLTPPPTAALTPEQAQQQKMMKFMTIGLFPVMMYAAPSGLALYFITNSALGILEHKWIRAHMNKHGLLDPEKIKAQRQSKGPGLMARMSEAAEMQRRLQEQAHGGRPPVPPSKRKKK